MAIGGDKMANVVSNNDINGKDVCDIIASMMAEFYKLYYNYENLNRKKVKVNSDSRLSKLKLLNIAKAMLVGDISLNVAMALFNKDPSFLQELSCIYASGFIGGFALNKGVKQELEVQKVVVKDSLAIADFNEQLLRKLFFESFANYVELKNIDLDKFDYEKELFKIYSSHMEKIMCEINENRKLIWKEVTFDRLFEIIEEFVDEKELINVLTCDDSKTGGKRSRIR